jgi:hypothetical protein
VLKYAFVELLMARAVSTCCSAFFLTRLPSYHPATFQLVDFGCATASQNSRGARWGSQGSMPNRCPLCPGELTRLSQYCLGIVHICDHFPLPFAVRVVLDSVLYVRYIQRTYIHIIALLPHPQPFTSIVPAQGRLFGDKVLFG